MSMDYSDSITIKITKVKYDGKPSHWEVDINDSGDGGTSPTFYGAWDTAYELISGDTGDYDSVHNTWIDFDANKDK
jgi:hypothetical protein